MRLIGTKEFYKKILALMIPILIQTGITNFVSMLDNIMVGRLGTAEMSGVAISNQLIFVFFLSVFGMVSGAGIFGAQFYGKGDIKGLRETFRFKLAFCLILVALFTAVFLLLEEKLIGLFLSGEAAEGQAELTLSYAKLYLRVMLIGLLPHALVQCYSSTLRETGQAVLPMVSGLVAVAVNLILNYVLIFGKLGAPALGVAGAAAATVIARFTELFILVIATAKKKDKYTFIQGAYSHFRIPGTLIKAILKAGFPLMANETLWALSMTTLSQAYSLRGLDVVAAYNINNTFFGVFSVVFQSCGVSIGILVGQQLGAGLMDKAKDTARKMIAFSIFTAVVVGALFAAVSGLIPLLYNTTDSIRLLARNLMLVTAVTLPVEACAHALYFTLRSVVKTIITIIFDSCFMWVLVVPVATVLSRYTDMPILPLFTVCQLLNVVKCVVGAVLVHRGKWANNLVGK